MFLPDILRDGKLRSTLSRGIPLGKYPRGDEGFVFFSPTPPGTELEMATDKQNVNLVFSMDSVMKAYPKFVMNDGNNWGPSPGKTNRKGTCNCMWTYNTMTNIDAPCVKHSLEDMKSVLVYSFEHCDGPEVAFPDEVDLIPHLLRIDINAAAFEEVEATVPEQYKKYIRRVGGRRKTRRGRKAKRTRKRRST